MARGWWLLVCLLGLGAWGAEFHGVVVDEGGQPVADALVAARNQQVWPEVEHWFTRTDAEGRWRLAPERTPRYVETEILAYAPGRYGAANADSRKSATIHLRGTHRVSGLVTDKAGQPIADVAVRVREHGAPAWHFGPEGMPPDVGPDEEDMRQMPYPRGWPQGEAAVAAGWPVPATTTDAAGRWTLDEFPVAGATLTLTHPDYAAGETVVVEDASEPAEPAVLAAAAIVAGRVVDGGQPVEGLEISALSQDRGVLVASDTTDAGGRYELGGLRVEPLMVGTYDPDAPSLVQPQQVGNLVAGQTTTLPDLPIAPSQLVTVRVLEAGTGAPVADLRLITDLPEYPVALNRALRTNDQGELILRARPGRVGLFLERVDEWLVTDESDRQVEVVAGQDPPPIVFNVERAQYIPGHLVVAGEPAGADYQLYFTAPAMQSMVSTDEGGGFELGPLPRRGQFELVVSDQDGYELARRTVAVADLPATGWQLGVPDVARVTLSGRVVDTDGEPVAGATVDVSGQAVNGGGMSIIRQVTTEDTGAWQVVGVPARIDYLATAQAPGYRRPPYGQQLPAGETRFSDLVLQPLTATVGGVVLDAAGQPVAGVPVIVLGMGGPEAVSGADGRFVVEGLPPGRLMLLAGDDDVAAGSRLATAATQTGATDVRLTLAPWRPTNRDRELEVAEEMLFTAWTEATDEAWFDRSQVAAELAELDPAGALQLAAYQPADKRAGVLEAVAITLTERAPALVLEALGLVDELPPVERARVRLTLALLLLDSDQAAAVPQIATATTVPPEADPVVHAMGALLAARLEQPGAVEAWTAALDRLVERAGDGSWASGLAVLAGERDEIWQPLLARVPQNSDVTAVPFASALGLAASQPRVAAQRVLEAAALTAAGGPTTTWGSYWSAKAPILAVLQHLPAAEVEPWLAQLPPEWGPAARLLAAAIAPAPDEARLRALIAEVSQVEQERSEVMALRELWPLLAKVAPAVVRQVVAENDAPEFAEARAAIRPVAARLELERQGAPQVEDGSAGVVGGYSLEAMVDLDLDRTLELLAGLPDKFWRLGQSLAIGRLLRLSPQERALERFAAPESMRRNYLLWMNMGMG